MICVYADVNACACVRMKTIVIFIFGLSNFIIYCKCWLLPHLKTGNQYCLIV